MTGQPIEPTLPEVLQSEAVIEVHPPVAVAVEGPVRTQPLPGIVSAVRKVTLGADNAPVLVANEEYRRKRLTLIAPGAFVFATDRGEVQGTLATLPTWPANVPFVWESVSPLWVRTGTTDTATLLTMVQELWTE